MSVSNPIKTIDKSKLDCGDKANVTISFNSKSELVARPADIILLFDKSSSMSGQKILEAKKGANDLIDIVTLASGGVIGGSIENKSRIGLIDFESVATSLSELTSDSTKIKKLINEITVGGRTNHADAFFKASRMIDKQSTNDKIVIMFTDGVSNIGGDANVQAQLLKDAGVEIYCILLGDNRTEVDLWASDPIDKHIASSTETNKLEELFKKISYEVIKVGASDVSIVEKVNKDFKITNILRTTPGISTIKDLQTIEWNMDAVGITENDTAELTFEIEYIGKDNKTINVNESLVYKDKDNNVLDFPNPTVELTCNTTVIVPDSCKTATTMQIEGCTDAKTLTVIETPVQDLGRIVQVDVPINNVCPNKRLAVGVVLTEVDTDGIEHKRGMKTVLIDPIVSDKCENIVVKCINFVLPEKLDMTGSEDSLCNTRDFKARVLVNYIDTDFVCCDTNTIIVE